MNKINILNVIVASLFIVILFGITNILQMLGITIGFIVVAFIWSWIITPKFITKESDEILHPITQIENTLHITNIQKHYGKKFKLNLVEKCSCGSTLFRVYNEDTNKGTHIQFLCAKCNLKATGLEFNWKEQRKTGETTTARVQEVRNKQ